MYKKTFLFLLVGFLSTQVLSGMKMKVEYDHDEPVEQTENDSKKISKALGRLLKGLKEKPIEFCWNCISYEMIDKALCSCRTMFLCADCGGIFLPSVWAGAIFILGLLEALEGRLLKGALASFSATSVATELLTLSFLSMFGMAIFSEHAENLFSFSGWCLREVDCYRKNFAKSREEGLSPSQALKKEMQRVYTESRLSRCVDKVCLAVKDYSLFLSIPLIPCALFGITILPASIYFDLAKGQNVFLRLVKSLGCMLPGLSIATPLVIKKLKTE